MAKAAARAAAAAAAAAAARKEATGQGVGWKLCMGSWTVVIVPVALGGYPLLVSFFGHACSCFCVCIVGVVGLDDKHPHADNRLSCHKVSGVLLRLFEAAQVR